MTVWSVSVFAVVKLDTMAEEVRRILYASRKRVFVPPTRTQQPSAGEHPDTNNVQKEPRQPQLQQKHRRGRRHKENSVVVLSGDSSAAAAVLAPQQVEAAAAVEASFTSRDETPTSHLACADTAAVDHQQQAQVEQASSERACAQSPSAKCLLPVSAIGKPERVCLSVCVCVCVCVC